MSAGSGPASAAAATRGPRMESFMPERLDPRAVLAYLAAVSACAFTLAHPAYLAALAASIWIVVGSTSRWRAYRPYLMFGAAAALATLVINPLVSRAGLTVLWDGPVLPVVGHMAVTAEAIGFGVGMGLRLFCVAGVFALYSTAVDPDAVFRLVAPLSAGSALLLALTVRLFPTVARDAERIMDAQRCRGQRLDSGGRLAKVAARIPVLDSLLLTSLERAMQIAESLESRGYGRPGRTRVRLAALEPRDLLLLAASALTLALGVALALGPARYAYYPLLPDPARPVDLALAPLLALSVAFPTFLAWGWTRSRWLRSRV
jgi:energy-coupling factor transport system permease protein